MTASTGARSRRTSADAESAPVYLWDPELERRHTVQAILEAGPQPIRVVASDEDIAAGPGPDSARSGAVVLLGVAVSSIQLADLQAIQRLNERGCQVIAYGAGCDALPLGVRCQALLAGAACLLDSGASLFEPELRRRLDAILQEFERERAERQHLRAAMAPLGLVGASPPMLSLFRWIARVSALSDVAALITGETGTGKELVARAIHALDAKRSRCPFVPLNCSALSPELAESELFGSRKGAFTGATCDRRGLIRSADGGVLFLDEVGDLGASLQAKLLRVLQESRVLSVGDDREVAVNVRVLAATNRNLRAMVEEGRFRADLFHRLGVLVTRVPALSERPDDVALLVDHFVEKYQALRPCRTRATPAFVSALEGLSVPGNVRELQNLVRHALVQRSDDAPLGLEDLPAEVWERLAHGEPSARPASRDVSREWFPVLEANEWNLARSLSACERIFVRAALDRTRGNQSETARLLGVTPRSIYNKIRKHRLHG